MATYLRHLKGHTIHHILLFPHVREMLEHFSPKPKFILSNKSDELMGIILKNNDLSKYFEKVMGGDTSPCLKPDPCVINDLLAKKKIDPKRTLLVGDMEVDIKTGQNAGILTCGVTYGFDGKDKLQAAKPD
jgi:phosphoglycolate phosphatase